MLRFLFDTDHLTLFFYGHPAVGTRLFGQPPNVVGLSVVTVEEILRGRLAPLARARTGPQRIVAYKHLAETVQLVKDFPIVPFDLTAEAEFQQLLALRLRVGTPDLKIAATALAQGLPLLTRNRRDFARIPGLLIDDWSV